MKKLSMQERMITMKLAYDYSKLDFTKPINRENIDWDIYENKFKFVDQVKAMKNPNPLYMKMIDSDYTMRSYYFLRINNEPLKLFSYQDIIINDTYRFKYFEAANQIGKSIELDVEAVNDFTKDHDKEYNIAIISKTLPQSTHQMRRIKQLLNSMSHLDWREDKGDSDSMSVLELAWKDEKRTDTKGNPVTKYVNRIICAPATEAALGYDLHKVFLDEFEFWDDDVYMHDQILEPRTYGTKGGMTVTTNPNGTETKGAELTRLILPDGTKKYHVYNFNFLDRPSNTQEELEAASAGKTRQVVESTLLAIRSISDKNYFTPDEIDRSRDKTLTELKMVNKQPFFFLDVGAKKDASVLVGGFIEPDDKIENLMHIYIPIIKPYPVGYPLSRVVGLTDEKQDSDGWEHHKSVKEHIEEWSIDGTIPTLGVDATGNSGIIPLMEAAKLQPIDVQFSGPVKSGMYQRFKYFMEKGLLHRIPNKQFDYEASHLEVRKSMRGYLMIHHEHEDDHDDVMDAIAGLIYIADNPDIVPATLSFF